MERKIAPGKFSKLLIFGDDFGLQQLIDLIPPELIVGIVSASIRPQYFDSVRKFAEKIGCKLFIQPVRNARNYNEFISGLKELAPDMILCNSYSMLIGSEILKIVNYNAINVHWALLPLNRGPNPVQWAIIKGEKKTGISVHYMDNGLDCGDIIAQEEEVILDTDTWVSLRERLKKRSGNFLQRCLADIISGKNDRLKQDEGKAVSNKRLTADYPKIDFMRMSDLEIVDLVRAQVYPLKGAYIEQNGGRIYFDKYLSRTEVAELRKKYAR